MFWFVGFASGTFGGFFLLKRECVSGIVEAAQQYLGHWLVASGPAVMFCPGLGLLLVLASLAIGVFQLADKGCV